MRTGVYVLELRNGGYYVGKSNDIDARVQQHSSGEGSAWCRHKGGIVGEVPTVYPGSVQDTSSWEMNETVNQMLIHGFENVRGWEFTGCGTLSSGELDTIKNVVMGQGDMCRTCGGVGHFASSCHTTKVQWLVDLESLRARVLCAAPPPSPVANPMSRAALSYNSEKTGGRDGRGGRGSHGGSGRTLSVCGGGVVKRNRPSSTPFCTRCGRDTHVKSTCFARTDVDGIQLDDSEDEDEVDDSEDEEVDDSDDEGEVDDSDDEGEMEESWFCEFCHKEFETKKGANFHENFYCHAKPGRGRRR